MGAGTPVPARWVDAPRVAFGSAQLERPAQVVERLREHWRTRQPVVVELDVSLARPGVLAAALRPACDTRPLWSLGPAHRLWRDELAFLLGANLVDARDVRGAHRERGGHDALRERTGDEVTSPIWWPARTAARAWAGLRVTSDPAGDGPDGWLADGRPLYIDGGPRGPIPSWPIGVALVHREDVERAGRLVPDPRLAHPPAPSEQLSDEQLAAVVHPAGPARVLAPAGAGKTRVLAARLRHLVLDRGVPPELITALAYNTRAAAELIERTRDVHVAGRRPQVRTVHALGLAICASALGRRPRILTEHDVRQVLARLDGSLRDPARADLAIGALTEVRLALRDPAEIAARGDLPDLPALVVRYRTWLEQHGHLDFDEQVHRAVALLLADPVLRARVGRTTTHLLVDEAQDLTPACVLLVRLLAGPAQQVFAVGDDDQTIYGYAGASPRVLVDLPDAYRGTASYPLTVNHRCPPAVVRAVTALLAHNTVRVAKTIAPGRDHTGAPEQAPELDVVGVDEEGTARAVVTRVREAIARHGTGGVAVLARVRATLLAPQVALAATGVPVHRVVGTEVLQRAGPRSALAYLRIAVRPGHVTPVDLAAVLRHPARRLTGVVQEDAVTSLAQLARAVPAIDAEHRAALHRLVRELQGLADLASRGATTHLLLRAVRDVIGLGASLDVLDAGRTRPEGSSHGDDLGALLEVAPLEPDPARFPTWLTEQLEDRVERASRISAGDGAERTRHDTGAGAGAGAVGDGITLSTIHRVKGREWDAVVLVGLRAGLIPHRRTEDVEEERRVLHVAMTRARRELTLVIDPARPSPFLPELLGSLRPAHLPDADEAAVLERLRAWRRDQAARDRVPAFLVAHDRTLADLARRRPRDHAALRACHGIGPAKAARYGDELLRRTAGP